LSGNAVESAFGRGSLAISLIVGSIGTLVLGLQPVLLGALLAEKRVTFDGLALVATAEMLAIGIGSVAFALLLSANRMRLKAAMLLVGVAIVHGLSADAMSLLALTGLRILAGLLEGGLIAVAVEAIARTANPGRSGGWFVVVQTLAQSISAALLALLVIPSWGSAGGFVALGVVSLGPLVLLPWLADDYGALPGGSASVVGQTGRSRRAVALLAIFSLYLFIGAIWAFLEPLGAQSGIDSITVGMIVAISLLVQVAGALAATALMPHIGYRRVIGGAAVVAFVLAIGFAGQVSAPLFWVLSLATGFLWLFVVPWQIDMTVDVDPSRRTALLVPAAQLFGAAIGPAAAAVFITADDFRPAAWFAASAALASLGFLLLLVLPGRPVHERLP
jgi:MFS family permease